MNGWAVVFLGIIALATAATAALQIGLIVYLMRLARRMTGFVDDIERELKPLVANANAVGRDAARASSLVLAQVERADRMFLDLGAKVTETISAVHSTVTGPAREGLAILAGIRAAISALRNQPAPAEEKPAEEEDTLFI